MLIRTFAIELARTHPQAVMVGLHPGTVDTPLSAPFRPNVAGSALFRPAEAPATLLAVLDALSPADSGEVRDWRGDIVPP